MLVVIFVAALVISSLVINRGIGDEIVDMGAPTVPRISFLVEGEPDKSALRICSGYGDPGNEGYDHTAGRGRIIVHEPGRRQQCSQRHPV